MHSELSLPTRDGGAPALSRGPASCRIALTVNGEPRLVDLEPRGRVLNPKLDTSQLMGGMLWGIGQALLEGN